MDKNGWMTSASSLPEQSLGYRLWMLRHAWTRRAEAALHPTGLTHTQFFLLRTIEHVMRQDLVPSQTQLADFLHVDRMTVSKVVRTLETREIVSRGVHPDDPRANSVKLTVNGFALLHAATRLVLAEQDRFFGRLGPEAKTAFMSMVDRLLEASDPNCPGQEPTTEMP